MGEWINKSWVKDDGSSIEMILIIRERGTGNTQRLG